MEKLYEGICLDNVTISLSEYSFKHSKIQSNCKCHIKLSAVVQIESPVFDWVFVFNRLENIGYQHFLLFSQYFQVFTSLAR